MTASPAPSWPQGIYDILIAREREDEPRESLEEVKQLLIADGKLDE